MYLRSRVHIRNLINRGLRVTQLCGWGLKSSGMWRCVVRRVVPDVSKDCDVLFLDCYPWRWRHYDLSKRRKPLTQRNRVTSQESWIFKEQSLSYCRFPPNFINLTVFNSIQKPATSLYHKPDSQTRSVQVCQRVGHVINKTGAFAKSLLQRRSNKNYTFRVRVFSLRWLTLKVHAPYYTYIAICVLSGASLFIHIITQTAWL